MNNLCPPGYAPSTKKLCNHAVSWQISFKFCRCSSYGVMTIWVKFLEKWRGCFNHFLRIDRNGPKRVLKLFKLWTLNQCLCFFNFVLICAWNLATLKRLIGYKFERKNISRKGTSIENIGRFEYWKEQKTQWIQHKPRCWWVGNFPSKEPNTLDFQLVDFLHVKSGKIDVVGKTQIERNLRKRNSTPLRPLLGLVFACIMNRNECSVIGKNVIFKTFMNIWRTVDCMRKRYRQIGKPTFDLRQALDRLLRSHAPQTTVVRIFALWRYFKGVLWRCETSKDNCQKTYQ